MILTKILTSNTITNTIWMLLEKLIKVAFSLFVGVMVARYLGPEDFGRLSYILAFAAFFSAISSFGIDSVAVKDLVQVKSNTGLTLGSSFTIKIFGGLISFVLCIISYYFFGDESVSIYLI
ncbi:oligosaccharide flippase family protein, partial [Vibrio breoganii]